MCLAQGPLRSDAGEALNPRPFGLKSSTLPLSHCSPLKGWNELCLSIYYADEIAHWTGWKSEVDKKITLCVLIRACELIRLNYHNDVAPGSDITPCNKIDKPLVVYRFSNVT